MFLTAELHVRNLVQSENVLGAQIIKRLFRV
jgi:hypothetical protein